MFISHNLYSIVVNVFILYGGVDDLLVSQVVATSIYLVLILSCNTLGKQLNKQFVLSKHVPVPAYVDSPPFLPFKVALILLVA